MSAAVGADVAAPVAPRRRALQDGLVKRQYYGLIMVVIELIPVHLVVDLGVIWK